MKWEKFLSYNTPVHKRMLFLHKGGGWEKGYMAWTGEPSGWCVIVATGTQAWKIEDVTHYMEIKLPDDEVEEIHQH